MRNCKFVGILLLLFSQMSWAGLIELSGTGAARNFGDSSPYYTLATSFIVDTDVFDSNPDPMRGAFLSAVKTGYVTLSNGRRFDLDLTVANVGNVQTVAVASGDNTFAMAALNLCLKFVDALGDMLTLSYSSHTRPEFVGVGFAGAGESLHGLENNLWFEADGEICISNCSSSMLVNADFQSLSVPVVTVPESQPLMLLLSGLLLVVGVRRFKSKTVG